MVINSEAGFAGRTALVTGGGSGIGRAIALALAARGMDVLVTGRRAPALAETVGSGEGIRQVVADVSDESAVGEIVSEAAGRLGRIDVVVNNAAVMRPGTMNTFDRRTASEMWGTNVLGPTMLAHSALAYLRESSGAIINISSTFGAKPAPGIGQYGATKAALEQLTRSWALELADAGVRVNAVAPGPTESEALAHSGMSAAEIEEVKRTERARIPLGRRGTPADVAHLVVALCDPAGGWITGQVIGVDGGYALV